MYGVFRLNLAQGLWRFGYAPPSTAAKIILAAEEGVRVNVQALPSGPYPIPVQLVEVRFQDYRPQVVCYTDQPGMETETRWDESEIKYVVLDL